MSERTDVRAQAAVAASAKGHRSLTGAVRGMLDALRRRSRPANGQAELAKTTRIRRVRRNGEVYRFVCPNRVISWRVRTFFTKEPETLEWIDTFDPGDVLFDVGANIGLYSIYAAKRSIRVMAFEPESQNYAVINQNICLNDVADRVKCVAVAMSDRNGVDYIYVSRFRPGESMHSFGGAQDWEGRTFAPSFQQGSVSFALDGFLEFQPEPFPTHLKIDVDGIEASIVRGARRTLADRRLKSLLVEFNGALVEDRTAIAEIERAGFVLRHRKRSPTFNVSKFPDVYNYVFARP
jgi:FkbM family methyltransferase